MYSIHHLVDSMFSGGNKRSWSVSHVGFISPDGMESQLSTWLHLEAQCDSISTFIRCNQLAHAQDILFSLRHCLDALVRVPDPLFLGKVWRLALVLRGLDRRAPQLQAMSKVFKRLKGASFALQGKECPISLIINSLIDIDEVDFTATMGLGFRLSLILLDESVSDENIIMLQLWSTYAQYFCRVHVKSIKAKRKNSQRLDQNPQNRPRSEIKASRLKYSAVQSQKFPAYDIEREVLFDKFLLVWHECYNIKHVPVKKWKTSDACILLSCYYAYAAFWVCNRPAEGEEEARFMREHTKCSLSAAPVWSIKAMAFGIASKVIATSHYNRREFHDGECALVEAIDILGEGDKFCLSRAISLCLTLASWRHKRKDQRGYQEAEQRLLALQDRIPGMNRCPNCRPSLKCQQCFEERAGCNKCMQDTKRKVCRTCKNAGTRRRRVIDIQEEHWVGEPHRPLPDSRQRNIRDASLQRTQRTTRASRHFSITGLPPSLTFRDFLGAIQHIGRVLASSIELGTDELCTSTANITFWDLTGAEKFWNEYREKGIQIGGCRGMVDRVNLVDSRLGRERSTNKGTWVPSRVLIVTGLTNGTAKQKEVEPGVAKGRVGDLMMDPTQRMTVDDVIKSFTKACSLDLDQVIASDLDEGNTIVEVRFGSWVGQARSCMNLYHRKWRKRGIEISYGIDPCT